MTAVRAKAPTLAWLLTALTCLLAGMAIVESRHQALALPHPEVHSEGHSDGTRLSIDVAKPVEVELPTGTPEPTSPPILGPGEPPATSPTSVVEVVPVSL